MFPSAACVVTLVDRLIHRSEIISLEGESYRRKESRECSARRKSGKCRAVKQAAP